MGGGYRTTNHGRPLPPTNRSFSAPDDLDDRHHHATTTTTTIAVIIVVVVVVNLTRPLLTPARHVSLSYEGRQARQRGASADPLRLLDNPEAIRSHLDNAERIADAVRVRPVQLNPPRLVPPHPAH